VDGHCVVCGGDPNKRCCVGQCYDKLSEYEKSIEFYSKVVNDYPDYDRAWYALFMVGRNYERLQKAGAVSKTQAEQQIKAAYKQLLEKYPDCETANIASRWLSKHNSEIRERQK
jgi:TolA-binding protein